MVISSKKHNFVKAKTMVEKVPKYVVRTFLTGVSRLPFSVLYVISGILFIFVYHVFRYRRDVTRRNLKLSFPEKTDDERKKIARQYYRYLCDLVVEILKTPVLKKEEILRRMVIKNPEVVNRYYDKGRSVIVMAMHYGNWEWLCCMPLLLKHYHFAVYKSQQDSKFEAHLNSVRARFGAEPVSMSITLRKILKAEKEGTCVLTGLLADQSPPWNHPFWTTFMNQPALFFNGPAKLAIRFNHPVLFQQIKRIKRGFYETSFEVLFENPREVSEETIINTYVRRIESVIREEPAWYLWSHKRWKYKKPGDKPVY